jgi:hypothetical protein
VHRNANRVSFWIADAGLPAEGLLGAARLARSLRSGPAAVATLGVQLGREAKLSNPSFLCRGFEFIPVFGRHRFA